MKKTIKPQTWTLMRPEPASWRWAGLFLLWTIPALLTTLQFHLRFLENGVTTSFTGILIFQLLVWYTWVPLTPLILWLTGKFPLLGGHRLKYLSLHIGFCLIIVLGYIAWYAYLFTFTGANQTVWAVFREFVYRYFQWYVMVYVAIVIAGIATANYRRYRQEEMGKVQLRAELTAARLDALQMQLRPHFLFNALNATAALVRKKANEDALEMVHGLSELLRQVLDAQDQPKVALAQELKLLNSYLAIEKVRFGNRLTIHCAIAEDCLESAVPNFILQPLVENAIRHGIGAKVGPGRIEITASRLDEVLQLAVRDNGPGLADEISTRVGIGNTHSRLQHMYGAGEWFSMKPLPEGGVEALLTIPFEKMLVQNEALQ